MPFELGGTTLEIAIGLAFVFFLLSIVVSAVTEGIAWALGVRAKKLKEGLTGMLGEAFSAELLKHPLTKNDLGSTAKGKNPSYLSPRNFSLALVQLLKGDGEGDVLPRLRRQVTALKKKTKKGSEEVDEDAKALGLQLEALLDEAHLLEGPKKQLEGFMKASETWFNDTMDRVSGWYKRWSQAVNIGVALFVAIGLNASTVRIVEHLESDSTVRSAVVGGAQGAAGGGEPKASGKAAQMAVEELGSLKIPILWSEENDPFAHFGFWPFMATLAGWLITAIAISLGAPFWFDALGKLAHLKTSGKKPETST